MTIPEHTLATVDEDERGRCRFVCACGVRGRFVATIPKALSADEWARDAHGWHAAMATDPTRPQDWSS